MQLNEHPFVPTGRVLLAPLNRSRLLIYHRVADEQADAKLVSDSTSSASPPGSMPSIGGAEETENAASASGDFFYKLSGNAGPPSSFENRRSGVATLADIKISDSASPLLIDWDSITCPEDHK